MHWFRCSLLNMWFTQSYGLIIDEKFMVTDTCSCRRIKVLWVLT